MSILKNVGLGIADVVEVVEESKDNIKKYYDDLVDKCKLTKEEVDELANQHFNKK